MGQDDRRGRRHLVTDQFSDTQGGNDRRDPHGCEEEERERPAEREASSAQEERRREAQQDPREGGDEGLSGGEGERVTHQGSVAEHLPCLGRSIPTGERARYQHPEGNQD